uniref:Reverse transcriptase domain-containing protein n=1 Tax=Rhodnius prolixus TaxID=13249 RepID=T1H9D4_RHOPR
MEALFYGPEIDETVPWPIQRDFSKAFDTIDHNILWKKLNLIGVSGKIIRIIKNLYEEVKEHLESI